MCIFHPAAGVCVSHSLFHVVCTFLPVGEVCVSHYLPGNVVLSVFLILYLMYVCLTV